MMGSPGTEHDREENEGPQYRVRITKAFYMGVTEVTQAQYEAVAARDPSMFKGPQLPVETVSWQDATAFCEVLSANTGRTVRLPAEAEWEYACRAGSSGPYSFGNEARRLGEYAWHGYGWRELGNSGHRTHPVGQKNPNAWGFYDMHGNVSEWCQDWYVGGYVGRSTDDPQSPATGIKRVIRGGNWYSPEYACRSASRWCYNLKDTLDTVGFRVVVVPE